jgi:hypothetical protein
VRQAGRFLSSQLRRDSCDDVVKTRVSVAAFEQVNQMLA